MVYSVHVYTVNQPRPFLLAFRHFGIWRLLARRRLPGYVATTVIRHQTCSSMWLVIHFWISEEAHIRALQSPTIAALEELTHRLSQNSRDLGVFTFETGIEEGDRIIDVFQSVTKACVAR
jgi:hypothetical protein